MANVKSELRFSELQYFIKPNSLLEKNNNYVLLIKCTQYWVGASLTKITTQCVAINEADQLGI